MKTQAKDLKEEISKEALAQAQKQDFDWHHWCDRLLDVKVKVYEDWWTKKDQVKKKDIANKEKFVIDAVMKGLNIDDSHIWRLTLEKVSSEEFRTELTIQPYQEREYYCA